MDEFGLNTIILQSTDLKKLVQKGNMAKMTKNHLNLQILGFYCIDGVISA